MSPWCHGPVILRSYVSFLYICFLVLRRLLPFFSCSAFPPVFFHQLAFPSTPALHLPLFPAFSGYQLLLVYLSSSSPVLQYLRSSCSSSSSLTKFGSQPVCCSWLYQFVLHCFPQTPTACFPDATFLFVFLMFTLLFVVIVSLYSLFLVSAFWSLL